MSTALTGLEDDPFLIEKKLNKLKILNQWWITVKALLLFGIVLFATTKFPTDAEKLAQIRVVQQSGLDFVAQQTRLAKGLAWIGRVTNPRLGNLSLEQFQSFASQYSGNALPNPASLREGQVHYKAIFTYPNVGLQMFSYMMLTNIRRMNFTESTGIILSGVAPLLGTVPIIISIASMIIMARFLLEWVTNLIYCKKRRDFLEKLQQQTSKQAVLFYVEREKLNLVIVQEIIISILAMILAAGMVSLGGYALMRDNDWDLDRSLRFTLGLFTGIGDPLEAPDYLADAEISYWQSIYLSTLMLWFSTAAAMIVASFYKTWRTWQFISVRKIELSKDELAYKRARWNQKRCLAYKE